MAQVVSKKCLGQLIAQANTLVDWSKYPVWIDYDEAADVLYLSFERPQDATNSRMRDDGVLLNYRGRKLVGVTIFEASKRG
jgi:uncharacterized protein YuzE